LTHVLLPLAAMRFRERAEESSEPPRESKALRLRSLSRQGRRRSAVAGCRMESGDADYLAARDLGAGRQAVVLGEVEMRLDVSVICHANAVELASAVAVVASDCVRVVVTTVAACSCARSPTTSSRLARHGC
jgi:hypothetical protein